jgi:nucleoid-associated protein YgaU
MAATFAHAELQLYRPTPKGPGHMIGQPIKFQFNPKEYTLKKAAKWEAKPAKGAPKASMPEFNGPEPQTMTIECFLDAVGSDYDITHDIRRLLDCCTPIKKSVQNSRPSPPFVVFAWGSYFSVTACVKSVSVKCTMFRPDGTPTRAIATLELQEVPGVPRVQHKQNPTSGGLDMRTSHTVVAGDSLASIANEEYGDPALWRAIAVANGITDPLRLRNGSRVLLPTPEEALGEA